MNDIRKKTTARTSRANEQRSAEPVHELYDDAFGEQGVLSAPPARPGYVQRWVRTALKNEDDPSRLATVQQQGWRPRTADTVPEGFYCPTFQDSKMGNVIKVREMVLMERPVEINERHAKVLKQRSDAQNQAIKHNLYREQENSSNMVLGFESQQSVARGRRPSILEDD